MIPEPYLYIRGITLGLGVLWSVRGVVRLWRFAALWGGRLEAVGLERRWLHYQLFRMTLRTTVGDPVNLGLVFLLFGSWLLRSWMQ